MMCTSTVWRFPAKWDRRSQVDFPFPIRPSNVRSVRVGDDPDGTLSNRWLPVRGARLASRCLRFHSPPPAEPQAIGKKQCEKQFVVQSVRVAIRFQASASRLIASDNLATPGTRPMVIWSLHRSGPDEVDPTEFQIRKTKGGPIDSCGREAVRLGLPRQKSMPGTWTLASEI